MGGERFDQSNPESYLFGENSDLNWFATKPTAVRLRDRAKALCSFLKEIFSFLTVSILATEEPRAHKSPQIIHQHPQGEREIREV